MEDPVRPGYSSPEAREARPLAEGEVTSSMVDACLGLLSGVVEANRTKAKTAFEALGINEKQAFASGAIQMMSAFDSIDVEAMRHMPQPQVVGLIEQFCTVLPAEIRGECLEQIPTITGAQVENFRQNCLTYKENRQPSRDLEAVSQNTSLEASQVNFLSLPQLDIGSIIDCSTTKADFLKKLTNRVYQDMKKWQNANAAIVENLKGSLAGSSEAGVRKSVLGTTSFSESSAGKGVDAIGGFLGGTVGSMHLTSFLTGAKTDLGEYPTLAVLFPEAGDMAPIYNLLKSQSTPQEFKSLIHLQLGTLFEGKTLDQIKETFSGKINGDEEIQNDQEALDRVIFLLDEIPTWMSTHTVAEDYRNYLFSLGTAALKKDVAMGFDEWFDKTDTVPGFQKMILKFCMLLNIGFIGDTVMGFMGDSKEGVEKDHLVDHYKSLKETPEQAAARIAAVNIDENALPESGESRVAQGALKNLETLFADQGIEGSLNIKVGDDESIFDHQEEYSDELARINAVMQDNPKAAIMLSKGHRISDLDYIFQRRNDEFLAGDGVNFELGEGKITASRDLDTIVDSFMATITGDVVQGAGVGETLGIPTGAVVAFRGIRNVYKSTGVSWLRKAWRMSIGGVLKGVAVGGATWLLGDSIAEIDGFSTEFSYSADPEELRSYVEQQRSYTKAVKSMVLSDLEKLGSDPDGFKAETLNAIKASGGFEDMLGSVSEFSNGYTPTAEDVEAFLSLEDQDVIDDGWFKDAFHHEGIDEGDSYVDSNGEIQTADKDIDQAFELNGTGNWGHYLNIFDGKSGEDLKFVDWKGFFAWAKNESSKSDA